MSEIDEVINNRSLTEQSKKNYRNYYNKIISSLGTTIKNQDEEVLIDVIEDISNDKISTMLSYLNIAILVKREFNKPSNILEDTREKYFKLREEQEKQPKQLDLPIYNDVKKYVNELTGVKYIVNYLIFNYGVRNKDVNTFITTREATKDINTNKNYLIVKAKEIEWIRNDYKTFTSHFQQRIIIKAKKFIDEIKKLDLQTWLLSGTANPIADTSLSNTISRMLFKHNDKNMTESDYFKLNVNHLQTKPNSYSKIIALGNIRGTDPKTIEAYYNVTNK